MAAKEDSISLPVSLFKGLALKPSIKDRDFNSAQLCSNFSKLLNGQGTTRFPTKCMFYQDDTNPHQVLFPFTYNYYDISTGANVQELLALGMSMDVSFAAQPVKLYRITENTLTISYSGTGNGTIAFVPTVDSGSIKWQTDVKSNGVSDISRTDVSASSFSNGTLSNLVAAIHALANFNCSPTSLPASASLAFVDVLPQNITIASGDSESFTYYDIEEVGEGESAPKVFTDANFILPSAIDYANVIYFAYGGYEYKYDGRNFYRSGLPQASLVSITEPGSGAAFVTGERLIYKVMYVRVDEKGNIIEGEDSDDTLAVATHTMAAPGDLNVTINNMASADYPNYALHSAKINGFQVGVNTITVDVGHTIEVGDVVFISQYVTTRNVTGTTATTITIDGAPINAADNAFISNNVRIQIYRTEIDGTDFFYLDEIANDASSATQVYLDTSPLGGSEPFTEQTRKNSTPPKCYYLDEHQGLKISSGDPDNPTRVRWTTPNNPEGYPLESNITDIKGGGLGAVTGIGRLSAERYAVFKEFGHVIIDGTLDDLAFKIDNKANTGIGCTSFRSLAYVGEKEALMGLSRKGVFINSDGVLSLAVGDGINPLIPTKQTPQVNGTDIPYAAWQDIIDDVEDASVELVLRRATAINDTLNSKYHLFIPAEIGTPGEQKVPYSGYNKYLVFDYEDTVPFWTEYTFYGRYRATKYGATRDVSPNAGFCIYKNKLWFGMSAFGASDQTDALLFQYEDDVGLDEYVEAAYPVYLDIHYIPFARVLTKINTFFKPLYATLFKFLADELADIDSTQGLGNNFVYSMKAVKDYKNYPTPAYILNSRRTFRVANGQTSVAHKFPTSKCRSVQLQLTTGDNDIGAYQAPIFDHIELIYSTPYDPKQKDPKGVNG